MSRRMGIVLPDPVAHQLRELAAGTGEPLATLAGQIVRDGVALAARDGNVRAQIGCRVRCDEILPRSVERFYPLGPEYMLN